MPDSDFLVIPEVSSERRDYIPLGFLSPETLCSNLLKIIPNATLYHFGVLSSAMHMAWVRRICGRLESRYRYSASIVYNNFPWPQAPTGKQKQAIENAAQMVLDTRRQYPKTSLANLYHQLYIPPPLTKAHHKLNAAVDRAYAKRTFSGDSDRLAFLFELYQQLASPLEVPPKKRRKRDSPAQLWPD